MNRENLSLACSCIGFLAIGGMAAGLFLGPVAMAAWPGAFTVGGWFAFNIGAAFLGVAGFVVGERI